MFYIVFTELLAIAKKIFVKLYSENSFRRMEKGAAS
jgi:hypothetical protein